MGDLSVNQDVCTYIIQSQEEEIKRIALELHEGVGQSLYSVLTGIQTIESGISQSAVKNYTKELGKILERTIHELRQLSLELHPPTLTTLGLLPAMKSYAKLYTSTFGVVVDIESTGEETVIDNQRSIAIFRVCQEALANTAKFADTSIVRISFNWKEDLLIIEINDFGKGFDVQGELELFKGVAAMRERMILVGGECIISSELGEGTSIELRLPL